LKIRSSAFRLSPSNPDYTHVQTKTSFSPAAVSFAQISHWLPAIGQWHRQKKKHWGSENNVTLPVTYSYRVPCGQGQKNIFVAHQVEMQSLKLQQYMRATWGLGRSPSRRRLTGKPPTLRRFSQTFLK